MPISKPDYQLTLPLDIEDTDLTPNGEGSLSAEEVRLRSESARAALNEVSYEALAWKEEYVSLVEGGWPWRVSAYMAWAASPRSTRTPKTQDELARMHLGLTSDRAINTWRRKNPAIDEMVAVLQSAPLWSHRAEIYDALIRVATSPDYKGHNDRKLVLELLGDYMPAAKLEAILKGSAKGSNVDTEDEDLLTKIEREAKGMVTPLSLSVTSPQIDPSTSLRSAQDDLGGEGEGE